ARTAAIGARRPTVSASSPVPGRGASGGAAGPPTDATGGGRVVTRYPDGTEAAGEVVELQPPDRIVFTYGYARGMPIPPGGSRVTIRLDPHAEGTRLHLTHEFAEAAVRDEHVQGWRYQLSLFGAVVANEVNAGAEGIVDEWFRVWALVDAREREQVLATIAHASVQFRDRFSVIEGMAELVP